MSDTYFCWHSDWWTGILVNYYNLSTHNDAKPFFRTLPQERMRAAFSNSILYEKPKGQCRMQYETGACNDASLVCHKVPASYFENKSRVE